MALGLLDTVSANRTLVLPLCESIVQDVSSESTNRTIPRGEDPASIANIVDLFSGLGLENDYPDGLLQRRRGVVARTVRRWLRRLGFDWWDIKKGVYTDGHERDDVRAYREQFLLLLEAYWPRVVEFNDDGGMIDKDYEKGVEVDALDPLMRALILITHDESIFQSNDGQHQAWVHKGHHFIRPKGRGQGIMVSDFLLPWSRLSTQSLPSERREELKLPDYASILFEYGREAGHWEGKDLVRHLTEIAIPMAEAVYPGYQFLFLFDNSSNHGLFASDALRASNMNLTPGGEQSFLRNGYFTGIDGTRYVQAMWYRVPPGIASDIPMGESQDTDTSTRMLSEGQVEEAIGVEGLGLERGKRVQKGLQRVLEERGLWPEGGLRLECPKNLCTRCVPVKNCRICKSGQKCAECKKKKVCSGPCSRPRKCDECECRRTCENCTTRKRCTRCTEYGSCRNCSTYASMPPRCTSQGMCTFYQFYLSLYTIDLS